MDWNTWINEANDAFTDDDESQCVECLRIWSDNFRFIPLDMVSTVNATAAKIADVVCKVADEAWTE